MNILLWTLQLLLALHTVMGAVWKFSHSAPQTMPSLKAISRGVWLGMSGFELLCSVGLILPFLGASLAILAPIAAACIAVEMLFLCRVHLASGDKRYQPMVYWLVVAVFCVFIAYGRIALAPL